MSKKIKREVIELLLRKYYNKNREYYESMLSSVDFENYVKYIDYLKPENGRRVLDVGCGVGTVVHYLSKQGFEAYGVEVSPIAIEIAQKRGPGVFKLYDGKKLPFSDEYFDSIGCKDVLEHTPYPEQLLNEMIRCLKPNGKIVITCPNFLRIFGLQGYHPRMSGLKNKLLNFYLCLKKIITYNLNKDANIEFEFMEPILDKPPAPDNDAVCVTNPIDIIFYLKSKGLKIVYHSACNIYYKSNIINKIGDLPVIRSLAGAVFVVAKKSKK